MSPAYNADSLPVDEVQSSFSLPLAPSGPPLAIDKMCDIRPVCFGSNFLTISALSISSLTRVEATGFLAARSDMEDIISDIFCPNSNAGGGCGPAPIGPSGAGGGTPGGPLDAGKGRDGGNGGTYLDPLIFLVDVVGTALGFDATGDLIPRPPFPLAIVVSFLLLAWEPWCWWHSCSCRWPSLRDLLRHQSPIALILGR